MKGGRVGSHSVTELEQQKSLAGINFKAPDESAAKVLARCIDSKHSWSTDGLIENK